MKLWLAQVCEDDAIKTSVLPAEDEAMARERLSKHHPIGDVVTLTCVEEIGGYNVVLVPKSPTTDTEGASRR